MVGAIGNLVSSILKSLDRLLCRPHVPVIDNQYLNIHTHDWPLQLPQRQFACGNSHSAVGVDAESAELLLKHFHELVYLIGSPGFWRVPGEWCHCHRLEAVGKPEIEPAAEFLLMFIRAHPWVDWQVDHLLAEVCETHGFKGGLRVEDVDGSTEPSHRLRQHDAPLAER